MTSTEPDTEEVAIEKVVKAGMMEEELSTCGAMLSGEIRSASWI